MSWRSISNDVDRDANLTPPWCVWRASAASVFGTTKPASAMLRAPRPRRAVRIRRRALSSPLIEELALLFIDMRASTAIAERLGELRYLRGQSSPRT
jgi:hypothetical protein